MVLNISELTLDVWPIVRANSSENMDSQIDTQKHIAYHIAQLTGYLI